MEEASVNTRKRYRLRTNPDPITGTFGCFLTTPFDILSCSMSVYHSCFSLAASFVLEVVACYVRVFLQRFRQSKQSKVPFLFLFLTLLLDWVPSVEIFRFNPEKKKEE